MGPEAVLIFGATESNSDLYYATSFFVPDPVLYLELDGKKHLLVGALEYGRAGVEASVDEVVLTLPYEEQLRADGQPVTPTGVLNLFLTEKSVRGLTVPVNFPFGHAERLRHLGYELTVREDPFYPDREVKTDDEITLIEAVQAVTEEAMDVAITMIKDSEIRNGTLFRSGQPLTSEDVRREVQAFLLRRDCHAPLVIVAGGDQATDPHCIGTGPLPSHTPIIIDIFPQSVVSRYWGDMTRTVVRGDASAAVRKLFEDVRDALDLACSLITDGAEGQDVHQRVADILRDRGNQNGEANGRQTGFIHSTGHGIGLDLHEWPRLGRVKSTLRAGQVTTVEPGLYYPATGAVRLEDAVVVTKNGCRNLNKYPKELEV